MAAYVIVDVTIEDQEKYEIYKPMVPASLESFGGEFIVRGGKSFTLEGEWNPQRVIVLRFPDIERAKSWWASQAYSEAKAIRQAAAKTKMIVIEGV